MPAKTKCFRTKDGSVVADYHLLPAFVSSDVIGYLVGNSGCDYKARDMKAGTNTTKLIKFGDTLKLMFTIDARGAYFRQGDVYAGLIAAVDGSELKYQLVVKLYLLEGYDHSEISEILKIPIKTSRTHLRRGKMELRNLLKT